MVGLSRPGLDVLHGRRSRYLSVAICLAAGRSAGWVLSGRGLQDWCGRGWENRKQKEPAFIFNPPQRSSHGCMLPIKHPHPSHYCILCGRTAFGHLLPNSSYKRFAAWSSGSWLNFGERGSGQCGTSSPGSGSACRSALRVFGCGDFRRLFLGAESGGLFASVCGSGGWAGRWRAACRVEGIEGFAAEVGFVF